MTGTTHHLSTPSDQHDECACEDAALPPGCDPLPLEDREAEILAELATEHEAILAFNGLRRSLDLHPQALTRTLQRLERHDQVEQDGDGYRLTDEGLCSLIALHRTDATDLLDRQQDGSARTLLDGQLPDWSAGASLAERLRGRWFRGLHWYGISGGPGETALHWLTSPGRHRVTMRIEGGHVRLEHDAPDEATDQVNRAARGLLQALGEVYTGTGSDGQGRRAAS